MLEEGKDKGDRVEAMVRELEEFVVRATVLQGVVLVAYAAGWVMVIRGKEQ